MAAGPSRPSSGAAVQHLVLRVRDIEASHHFYTEILGFEQCAALGEDFKVDMRFYRGDENHHHDFALCQLADPSVIPAPNRWAMFNNEPGIDHIAMKYPDRESWLNQIAWMKSQNVEFIVRGNHGMTHSAYIQDPDGNGIEVLYDVPKEAWEGDVNAALNYFEYLPPDGDETLEDSTDYVKF
jgi:catechol 2,3-dioxygenase